ncbi:MAG: outer membrane protein assembly factor BamD [Candidatus Omnitrophica bacterium]|nr:outer membrane protein assembly factor BamD [Candidatus Omnitrophota bacterium]
MKITIIIILTIFLFAIDGYSQDKELYNKATKLARDKKIDFAFSYLDMVVNIYPKSRFFENSLFSCGEYYFISGDRYSAKNIFKKFIALLPESKAKPFALAYLLKIAELDKKQDIVDNLQKEIISFKQVSLVFRDFKEYSYLSALNKEYKIVYFIDSVEIYIDGNLFEKIPF